MFYSRNLYLLTLSILLTGCTQTFLVGNDGVPVPAYLLYVSDVELPAEIKAGEGFNANFHIEMPARPDKLAKASGWTIAHSEESSGSILTYHAWVFDSDPSIGTAHEVQVPFMFGEAGDYTLRIQTAVTPEAAGYEAPIVPNFGIFPSPPQATFIEFPITVKPSS